MGIFDFLKKKEFAIIAQLQQENNKLTNHVQNLAQYQCVVDINELIAKKKSELFAEEQQHVSRINELKQSMAELAENYKNSHAVYDGLKRQIEIFKESLEMTEFGVYEPHFSFDTSEKFKNEILKTRKNQKYLITNNGAVLGGEGITWNNSKSQGQAMVNREKKLMLRAFNGECDSFIASVEWNNVNKMIERINKSFEAINKVYEVQSIRISTSYLKLKIEELKLTYEYKKKKNDEKEEQKIIREMMREEEKVQREIEAAKIKAEKEENSYKKALENAKNEAQNSTGKTQEKLLQQIEELEERLREVEKNKERALSMAQQTRRGYVYIISNIGSFGPDVYKIGMTRRLEPMDRVNELGDASVPFSFDVHALIFSEDAPTLENTLHKAFDSRRVNMINNKREFFNVSLDEIEAEVVKNHGSIEFTKIAEAEQYRESLALKCRHSNSVVNSNDFPISLSV